MEQLRNRKWWEAVLVRMVRTAAQAGLGMVGANAVGVTDVDWTGMASAAALAAVVTLLMSLSGLPEVGE